VVREPGRKIIPIQTEGITMKMLIDDQWVEASDKAWMEIRNPELRGA
jgi:hypothetical protein